MCNYDYLKLEVENNDNIYIDSCSTMEYEGFESFVDNIRELLVQNNKKIIIIVEVYFELIKHSYSEDQNKRESATNAITIIQNNKDIFEVEEIEAYDSNKTFADPKLLSHLLSNIANQRQLLITNDNALSSDAYKFNALNSIKGHKIHVCYINRIGEMHKCRCTYNTDEFTPATTIERVVEKPIYVKPSVYKTYIEPMLIGLGAGVLYENRKKIIKTTINAFDNLIKLFV